MKNFAPLSWIKSQCWPLLGGPLLNEHLETVGRWNISFYNPKTHDKELSYSERSTEKLRKMWLTGYCSDVWRHEIVTELFSLICFHLLKQKAKAWHLEKTSECLPGFLRTTFSVIRRRVCLLDTGGWMECWRLVTMVSPWFLCLTLVTSLTTPSLQSTLGLVKYYFQTR